MRTTGIYFEKVETEMGGKCSKVTADSGSVAWLTGVLDISGKKLVYYHLVFCMK